MGSEIGDARASALNRLAGARVATLGTVGPSGQVRLVPICFALDGERIVSAVDHKPKTTTALARLADIERVGHATIIVDHYDDSDWSALWWVRAAGAATVHDPTDPQREAVVARLAAKYPQYEEIRPAGPTYSILIDTLDWWSATP